MTKARYTGIEVNDGKYVIFSTIPDTYATAVGQIVTEWAFCEFAVERLIRQLLSISPEETRIIATQMNIRPKLEIVNLLSKRLITNAAVLKQISLATKQVSALNELRNKVVHGTWGAPARKTRRKTNPKKMIIFWYRGKGDHRVTPEIIPVTSAGLKGIVADIKNLNMVLLFLNLNIAASLSPSQSKSSP